MTSSKVTITMSRLLVLVVLVSSDSVGGVVSGLLRGGVPYIPATLGRVWPTPQQQQTNQSYVIVRPPAFKFSVIGKTCDILTNAVDRYSALMIPQTQVVNSRPESNTSEVELETLSIELTKECEDLPYLHMDEQYELVINSPGRPGEGAIVSASVWGVLRALETFSQLLVPTGDNFRVNSTKIKDYPRFAHRGFMIDSSRHYLPVSTIKEMLDLMSINKYNVLHWHVVDSQSFPYKSDVLPDLSRLGAWTARHVYTAADIAEVVSYAVERGIRVMPEFDTPGHTESWGPGQPNLLTECFKSGEPDGTFGPIDPSYEGNYDFLKTLLTEVTQRFPDHYLHLGGDEVPFDCWKSNPKLTDFMKEQNITGDYAALEQYYITRLLEIVSHLPTKNGYLVWQEVFDNGVKLASDTIVHIWKDGGSKGVLQEELAKVTAGGYQTLLSSCWYLNYISYGVDWHKYYECDPQDFAGTDAQKALVVGGEACMWGEWVDRTNIISRSFPRGSVVAEKLWSDVSDTQDVDEASPRLEEHRCRMLARGYDVEPLWPSFCDADIQ